MKIITIKHIFLFIFLSLSSTSYAVTCPSGEAAERGGTGGYERDKEEANRNADKERSASDILGKCIEGITSVMTVPQFPSISEIYSQILNKICKIASEKADEAMNDANITIDGGWKDVISNISRSASLQSSNLAKSSLPSTNSIINTDNSPITVVEQDNTDDAERLKNIWK